GVVRGPSAGRLAKVEPDARENPGRRPLSDGGRRPRNVQGVEAAEAVLAQRAVPYVGEAFGGPRAGHGRGAQGRGVREKGDLAAAHADHLAGDVRGPVAG